MTDLPPEVESPRLLAFHEYWRGKCRDGRLPARADLDPVEFADAMASIIIIDFEGQGAARRYRFRLFGTEHVEFNQRDLTGKFIDEVFRPDDAARVAEAYARVIETRAPHYWRTHVMLPGREFVHYERLMLPLASDGERVDMLIGVFQFDRIEPADKA